MTKIETNAQLDDLLTKWAAAKDAELQWQNYRRLLEDQITALQGGYATVVNNLRSGTTLTKSMEIGKAKVQVGYDLSVDQPKAIEFLATYPHLHSVVLVPVYKPTSSKAVLTAMQSETEVGKALKDVVSYKERRPSYSATK